MLRTDADERLPSRRSWELALAGSQSSRHRSTAIENWTPEGTPLRFFWSGRRRMVRCPQSPSMYEPVDLLDDFVWYRLQDGCTLRFRSFPNMNDVDLPAPPFCRCRGAWHPGHALHDSASSASALTNGEGVNPRMLTAKGQILRRLKRGFLDPNTRPGRGRSRCRGSCTIDAAEASYEAACGGAAGAVVRGPSRADAALFFFQRHRLGTSPALRDGPLGTGLEATQDLLPPRRAASPLHAAEDRTESGPQISRRMWSPAPTVGPRGDSSAPAQR